MVSLKPIRSDQAIKKKLVARTIKVDGQKRNLDVSGASTKNLMDSKSENRRK